MFFLLFADSSNSAVFALRSRKVLKIQSCISLEIGEECEMPVCSFFFFSFSGSSNRELWDR